MDTFSAFARGEANKHKPVRTFDWDKATQYLKDHNPDSAQAGLSSDLEYTAGEIWSNGEIVSDSYTFLSSTWATPVLVMDGAEIDCWKYESDTDGWNCDTVWPDSARKIIDSE